jgi:hypothetical protein
VEEGNEAESRVTSISEQYLQGIKDMGVDVYECLSSCHFPLFSGTLTVGCYLKQARRRTVRNRRGHFPHSSHLHDHDRSCSEEVV